MKQLGLKAIANIFRRVADKIEAGTCEADQETLMEMANMLLHVKLNAEQMCHYLNCSRSTLTRMICDGKIPHPRKELGETTKYWWQDEVDDWIRKYEDKYGK